MRKSIVVLVTVVAATGFTSTAVAEEVSPADACKNGGHVRYVEPTTDAAFKNQGRCIAFVRTGGVLSPVKEDPPHQVVSISPTAIKVDWINEEAFIFQVSSSGLTPSGSVVVDIGLEDGQQFVQNGVADASGNWISDTIGLFCANPGDLIVRDLATGVTSEPLEWPFDGLCAMAGDPAITTSEFRNVHDVPLVRVGVEGFAPYSEVRVTLTSSTGGFLASTLVVVSSYGNEYAAFSPSVCDYPDNFLFATATQGDIVLTRDIRTTDPNCALR